MKLWPNRTFLTAASSLLMIALGSCSLTPQQTGSNFSHPIKLTNNGSKVIAKKTSVSATNTQVRHYRKHGNQCLEVNHIPTGIGEEPLGSGKATGTGERPLGSVQKATGTGEGPPGIKK